MIEAFSAILECMVTGLFTALFIWLGCKFNLLPLIFMQTLTEEEMEQMTEEEEDQ